MPKTLNEILHCPEGVITGFARETRLTRRLREVGLTPGASVKMYMPAPLGDPVAVSVENSVFAVRKKDLLDIEYAPCEANACR